MENLIVGAVVGVCLIYVVWRARRTFKSNGCGCGCGGRGGGAEKKGRGGGCGCGGCAGCNGGKDAETTDGGSKGEK